MVSAYYHDESLCISSREFSNVTSKQKLVSNFSSSKHYKSTKSTITTQNILEVTQRRPAREIRTPALVSESSSK